MPDSAPPRTGRELRNIQVDRRFQAIPANGAGADERVVSSLNLVGGEMLATALLNETENSTPSRYGWRLRAAGDSMA
jgi:hypothetical protein